MKLVTVLVSLLASLSAFVAFSSPQPAASQTVTYQTSITDGATIFNLPSFQSGIGTLTKVEFRVDGKMRETDLVENLDPSEGTRYKFYTPPDSDNSITMEVGFQCDPPCPGAGCCQQQPSGIMCDTDVFLGSRPQSTLTSYDGTTDYAGSSGDTVVTDSLTAIGDWHEHTDSALLSYVTTSGPGQLNMTIGDSSTTSCGCGGATFSSSAVGISRTGRVRYTYN